MSPIKVIHLIASTGIGGAERVLLDICRSLESERLRFEVGLFVGRGCGEENMLGKMLKKYHIPLHFIEMHFPLSPSEIMTLTRIFRKTGASLVHCHGVRADVFGGAAAKLCRLPAISTVHGFVPFSRKMQFYTWLDQRSLRLFDRVLPVSERLQRELIANGMAPRKIQLVPNVPPLNGHRPGRPLTGTSGKPALQIGFVGRLSPEKGVLILLGAVARLKTDPAFVLHVVGDGPEMAELTARIKDLGLTGRVKAHGHLSDPHEIYDILDILVLPFLTEGIPLTALEGMSRGLPIIASNVGGVPEVIEDHRNGILVEPGSVSDLAEKLTLLAGSPDLRKRLGSAAREAAAILCDHNRWEQQILNEYERYGGSHDALS